jgi:micrococcal nuclease
VSTFTEGLAAGEAVAASCRYACAMPLVAILLCLLSASALAADADTFTARVVSVHDGDTITALADGNRQVKVRLAGIDAPELGQPFGQAAKRHLSGLTFGKTVEIEADEKDRWGRTLGSVKVDGKPAAEAMVSEGLAWHYTRFNDDQRLAKAEKEARRARRGLWQDPQPVPPWEWRKNGRERKAPR